MLLLTYSHFCHEAPHRCLFSPLSLPKVQIIFASLCFFEKQPCQRQRKQHAFKNFPSPNTPTFPQMCRTFPLNPHFIYILLILWNEGREVLWGSDTAAPYCTDPPSSRRPTVPLSPSYSHSFSLTLLHPRLLQKCLMLFHTSVGSVLLHMCLCGRRKKVHGIPFLSPESHIFLFIYSLRKLDDLEQVDQGPNVDILVQNIVPTARRSHIQSQILSFCCSHVLPGPLWVPLPSSHSLDMSLTSETHQSSRTEAPNFRNCD